MWLPPLNYILYIMQPYLWITIIRIMTKFKISSPTMTWWLSWRLSLNSSCIRLYLNINLTRYIALMVKLNQFYLRLGRISICISLSQVALMVYTIYYGNIINNNIWWLGLYFTTHYIIYIIVPLMLISFHLFLIN